MVLLRVALFPPPPHFPLSLKMAYILSALHFFSQSLFPPHPCKCPAPLKHLDSIPLPCCSHLPSFWTQSCGHSFSFSEYLITSLLPISLPLLCHLSLKTTNSMETHFLEIHFLDVLISNHLVFYLYQVPHPNFTTPITTSPQKHQLYGHEIIVTTPPPRSLKNRPNHFSLYYPVISLLPSLYNLHPILWTILITTPVYIPGLPYLSFILL